jgi:hypothetical protein
MTLEALATMSDDPLVSLPAVAARHQPPGPGTTAVSGDKKLNHALGYHPADASLQKLAALHGSIHNHFNQERHLSSRPAFKDRRAAALTEWRQLCAA